MGGRWGGSPVVRQQVASGPLSGRCVAPAPALLSLLPAETVRGVNKHFCLVYWHPWEVWGRI